MPLEAGVGRDDGCGMESWRSPPSKGVTSDAELAPTRWALEARDLKASQNATPAMMAMSPPTMNALEDANGAGASIGAPSPPPGAPDWLPAAPPCASRGAEPSPET